LALRLDAASLQFIDTPDETFLSEWSSMAWVVGDYDAADAADDSAVIGRGDNYQILWNGTTPRFACGHFHTTGAAVPFAKFSDLGGYATLKALRVYHLAFTYSTTAKRLRTYVNGAMTEELIIAPATVAPAAGIHLRLGLTGITPPGTAADYWSGIMEDARVYNTELTPADIASIVSTRGDYLLTSSYLEARYALDGVTGVVTTVPDSGPYGYTGVPVNAPVWVPSIIPPARAGTDWYLNQYDSAVWTLDPDGFMLFCFELLEVVRKQSVADYKGLQALFDADRCPSQYLPFLASQIGEQFSDLDLRNVRVLIIRRAAEWLKRKGLVSGFQELYETVGFTPTVKGMWIDENGTPDFGPDDGGTLSTPECTPYARIDLTLVGDQPWSVNYAASTPNPYDDVLYKVEEVRPAHVLLYGWHPPPGPPH